MKSRLALPPPTQRIRQVFGWDDFPGALIYDAPFSLRFELGDSLPNGLSRFLRAIDRSRQIVRAAFLDSSELTVIASYIDDEKPADRHLPRDFKVLAEMGFKARFGRPERLKQNDSGHIEQFGQDSAKYWRAAEIPNDPDQIDILLWLSAARYGIVKPGAWRLYIHVVDFRRGIVAYIYDDRGMDIAATNRELIQPIYDRFGEWFLDCDREKMDRVFSRNP